MKSFLAGGQPSAPTNLMDTLSTRHFHLAQSSQGQQIESHRPQYDEPEAQTVQTRGQQVRQGAAEREGCHVEGHQGGVSRWEEFGHQRDNADQGELEGSIFHLESHQRVMNQAAAIVRKIIPMKNNWSESIPELKIGDGGGCRT